MFIKNNIMCKHSGSAVEISAYKDGKSVSTWYSFLIHHNELT